MPSTPVDRTVLPFARRRAAESHPPAHPPSRPPRQVASDALLGNEREVLIRHGDQLYRLRHTRAGKLILTK